MDSHDIPSTSTEAAQRGPISPWGKGKSVLKMSRDCIGSLFRSSVSKVLGLWELGVSAPGGPTAGAATSLKQREQQPAVLQSLLVSFLTQHSFL